MGNAMELGAMVRLLGRKNETPGAAIRYRNVAVTKHLLDERAGWTWSRQDTPGDEVAAVVFANVPMRVTAEGWPDAVVEPGGLCFLHPLRGQSVLAEARGIGSCLWVPWDALSEIEDGLRAPGPVVAATTLTGGLRAFVSSLLSQTAPPTPYTDFLVERILAEMVFGVLVEAASRGANATREPRAIDRLRTLMLIRRADPGFGIEEMARELHVTRRQVQRIFSGEGSTPADELRSLRVDLAQELLTDETYHPLSMDEIAAHSGFVSAAALRRAFAALGLPAPSRRRRAV